MKGLHAPLRITPRGKLHTAQGNELLRQQVAAALLTRAAWHTDTIHASGERLMRPQFGCRMHHLLHEPLNDETVALLEALLVEDLQHSLPHVTLTHLHSQLDEQHARLHMRLGFATAAGESFAHTLHWDSQGITLNTPHHP